MERMSVNRNRTISQHTIVGGLLIGLLLAVATTSSHDRSALALSGNNIATPDTMVFGGSGTAIALDAAGNPVVAYGDGVYLKVLHCNDPLCNGGDDSIQIPTDSDYPVPRYPEDISLIIPPSGNPLISFYKGDTGDLVVLQCSNPDCYGYFETFGTVDSTGDVGRHSSVTLSQGLPAISYYDATNGDLKFVRCNDSHCSPAVSGPEQTNVVDSAGNVGLRTSLRLNGLNPVISYFEDVSSSFDEFRVASCNDPLCIGGNEFVDNVSVDYFVDDIIEGVATTSAQGGPVLAYLGFDGGFALRLFIQSTGEVQTVDGLGEALAVSVDASGRPVVVYLDSVTDSLKILRCNDASCENDDEMLQVVDGPGLTTEHVAFLFDSPGRPIMAYRDNNADALKVVHCGVSTCGPKTNDADADGCADDREFGANQLSGGQRDYVNFWDFFDTPNAANVRDKAVAAVDFNRVLQRFGANDSGPGTFDRFSDPLSAPNPYVMGAHRENYHPAFDRGPSNGPNAWNLTAANGAIAATDFNAALAQFGHNCA